jgi:hypothetical protein
MNLKFKKNQVSTTNTDVHSIATTASACKCQIFSNIVYSRINVFILGVLKFDFITVILNFTNFFENNVWIKKKIGVASAMALASAPNFISNNFGFILRKISQKKINRKMPQTDS